MSLENIYGKGFVVAEARVVGRALTAAARCETAHLQDRDGWTPENPTYGHCDLFTAICILIWARKMLGKIKWEPEAKKLVWWAYGSYSAFLEGVKKNKLTVHWSLMHPRYGEFDLSREQFPDGTYLHPRPRPLSHEVPVDRSWDVSSEITKRKQLIGPDFIAELLRTAWPAKLTQELDSFLEGLARGETFGLIK